MRQDLFQRRKSVHVKLTKESHTALREMLFKHSVTMQDVFQEFIDEILKDEKKASRIIARVVEKKLMAEIRRSENGLQPMGEYDSDTLYNLLERSNSSDDDDLQP